MEQNQVSKQICNVLKTGSKGNCVIYHNTIAVDMGVSFKTIEPYKKQIQLVLCTHVHLDHLNIKTIKRLALERPALRFGIGIWLKDLFEGIKNVDILEPGLIYDYGQFKISPFKLYHDCKIYGYRIFKGDHKTFHATDSYTLNGITAKSYSLYCIEMNYSEEVINQRIAEKKKTGSFCYEIGASNSHLSEEQAKEWLFKNMGEESKVLRLHQSSNNI